MCVKSQHGCLALRKYRENPSLVVTLPVKAVVVDVRICISTGLSGLNVVGDEHTMLLNLII